jgi:hypothetical protein
VAAACECVYSTGKVHFSADKISLTFEFSPSRGTAERFIFYFTSTLSLSLFPQKISLLSPKFSAALHLPKLMAGFCQNCLFCDGRKIDF